MESSAYCPEYNLRIWDLHHYLNECAPYASMGKQYFWSKLLTSQDFLEYLNGKNWIRLYNYFCAA